MVSNKEVRKKINIQIAQSQLKNISVPHPRKKDAATIQKSFFEPMHYGAFYQKSFILI